MKTTSKISGFSLVEVALATGILAFAFSVLLAVLSTALNNSAASQQDTVLAFIANAVTDDLRRQHFVDSLHPNGTLGVLAGTANVTGAVPAATSLSTIYFDYAGTQLTSANGGDLTQSGAVAAGAFYQCARTVQPVATTLGTADANGTQMVNEVSVILTIGWPVLPSSSSSTSLSSPSNVRTIRTSIARF